jgi:chromosome condensin MukBEF ATPase and DNA-binding subunit MukB
MANAQPPAGAQLLVDVARAGANLVEDAAQAPQRMAQLEQRMDQRHDQLLQRMDQRDAQAAQRHDQLVNTMLQLGEALLQRMDQRHDQVVNSLQQVHQRTAQLSNRVQNMEARSNNREAAVDLLWLVNEAGQLPEQHGLPANAADVRRLDDPAVRRYLQFYNLSEEGSAPERMRRLLCQLGIVPAAGV